VNGGDEGEGIGWWDSYTHMKENNETSDNCFKWVGEGFAVGRW
jgi:hypothetical protein